MESGWWVTNGQWLEKMGGMTYRVADNKTAVAKKKKESRGGDRRRGGGW
jgi:hypothetical protein